MVKIGSILRKTFFQVWLNWEANMCTYIFFIFCDVLPWYINMIYQENLCAYVGFWISFVSNFFFWSKISFWWKYLENLINHNLGTSHQSLKKTSGSYIDHKRNKICKNEGFLNLSLLHAALFLQKNGS